MRAALVAACLLGSAPRARAQDFEITPFGGYRFGGDFFETMALQPLDIDGATAFGAVVDVPMSRGSQFEALFTHQSAIVDALSYPSGTRSGWNMLVEHFQAGGLREFHSGSIRPFLTGSLGLTRYATGGDNEIRFAFGAGGGVKLLPGNAVGLRLGTQVYATFTDADASAVACGPGGCFLGINASVLWQIEFTAGMIIRFR